VPENRSSNKRPVDGVLLLDKPGGITSNGALQRVKRMFLAVKAGHVGTLDPLATGLLPVCLGEATKFSSGVFRADKVYEADIALGITTTTGDAEGDVTDRREVAVDLPRVETVLRAFVGSIEQTPPMHSALKREGKPLYLYARRGEKLDLQPRLVAIHGIRVLAFEGTRLRCEIACGSGTYIRVLAEDIGRALGCGASLAGLRRTAVGAFRVTAATTLGSLEAATMDERLRFLLPVDSLVSQFPPVKLLPADARRVLAGGGCRLADSELRGAVRLYSAATGRFLGLAEAMPGGDLVPKRLIASSGDSREGASRSIT
jgi:tRNA pseudouridine55 synthase